ncbi:MAG: MoaD/ThiS family protein [Bdellovibrionales bacterium]|nr:MoaD/ThiS family protein [Bdellovibrionales bacterium]
MAKVIIPESLKRFFGGKAEHVETGGSLLEVLRALEGDFPEGRQKILDSKGGIRMSLKIFVDGEDVPASEMAITPVTAHSRIKVIMALAGG